MTRGPERIFDEYLVLTSQAGSREAADHLVRRWTPRLLRHASHMLGPGDDVARDVVQETWFSVMRGLRRLSDPARFPAWIYAIATRKCADVIRRKQRNRRLDSAVAMETLANPANTGVLPDDRMDLRAALAALPRDQLIIVSMFYGDDLSVEEIGAALGIPSGTAKSRLFNARQALKALMERVSA
jgi:RNA polymerase sigma-70 factor (ECF subfamily)